MRETDRPQSHISREEFNKHKKQTHLRLSEVKMPANVINENASKCHQYALNSHRETPGRGGLKAAATSMLQRTAAPHSGTVVKQGPW